MFLSESSRLQERRKISRQLIFPAGGTGAKDEEDENTRVLEVRSECSSPGDLEEAQKAVNGVMNETGKVYEKCRATGILKSLSQIAQRITDAVDTVCTPVSYFYLFPITF